VDVCVAKYAIEVKPSAHKELEKLEGLAADPRPSGCKKLRGYKDLWRIRIGDYRVVYIIDDAQKIVRITRVAHRSDVY